MNPNSIVQQFIEHLYALGKSEEECARILADITSACIKKLYEEQKEKYGENYQEVIEQKLTKLRAFNASQQERFEALGITPELLLQEAKKYFEKYGFHYQ